MSEIKQNNTYMKGFIPYALAAFLVGIVGGFTAVLAPAFVKDMGLAYNNTTWLSLALAMSTAACAPILGKLGDVLGRRRTLLLGICIFGAGNVLTAIANSLLFMLAARFVVGVGTAAIAPVVMSYIVTEFPPAATGKGFSMYMLISSCAVIFGPTLGGILMAATSWRIMMWVCVGMCVAAFAACALLKDPNGMERRPLKNFDGLGAVFVLIFFSLFLCVPSFGQNIGWTSRAFALVAIAAVVSLAVLVYAEKKAANPILSAGFMMRKPFVLSVLALLLTQGLMQANMTNVIVFVNYTQPGNTLISGYAISIMYLGMSLGSVLVGPQADKKEPRKVLSVSLLLTGIGCALMLLFSENTPFVLMAGALGILGFGLGGNGAIFMKVVLSGLSPQMAGAGTGTYGLFRDISAPFGVAVFVPMFTNGVTNRMAHDASLLAGSAAVGSIHTLAIVEIVCVAAAIVLVNLLPKREN
jgi:MFS family permease